MSWLKTWLGRDISPPTPHAQPPAPPFGQTPWHPTHRHKKGGGYRLLGYGVLEADRSRVAIYDDADGTVWVRSADEFEDGRFSPITLVAVDEAAQPSDD
ncbi:hypothetical protein [Pseudooctadecabacter jejudonensis]|uniref:DUF1653 domain-containing protein n=1 Tax=Pseudooctadecabacter jejudonensis TaxID=1391910 RepID=A0A1Y5TBC6_9RHOB|nr:hypothetical protein [Pseudooctadecabacter jejudonensis]SLN58097.1 hypothetical protein PSJ8397_03041 [Pseudooctadecabacter jejudonensis]